MTRVIVTIMLLVVAAGCSNFEKKIPSVQDRVGRMRDLATIRQTELPPPAGFLIPSSEYVLDVDETNVPEFTTGVCDGMLIFPGFKFAALGALQETFPGISLNGAATGPGSVVLRIDNVIATTRPTGNNYVRINASYTVHSVAGDVIYGTLVGAASRFNSMQGDNGACEIRSRLVDSAMQLAVRHVLTDLRDQMATLGVVS